MESSDARSRMTVYSLRQWMREQKKYFLSEKLEEFSGNIFLTAKSYQIGVRTLSRKMHYHGLTKVAYRAAQKQLTFERIEKRIRESKDGAREHPTCGRRSQSNPAASVWCPFEHPLICHLLRDDALLDEQLCQRVGLGQAGHEKFL